MHGRKLKPPSLATGLAIVALFVALGGTGYAVVSSSGIPDHAGVFHGCVDRRTGTLRVVQSARSCRRAHGKGRRRSLGEFAINWSQKGPPGVPGLAGRNGTSGTNGINGTNGTNGASGSAIAYAAIDSSGNVDESNSKGFPQTPLTHVHTGIYCVSSPNFTPHVINVTAANNGSAVGAEVTGPPVSNATWLSLCGTASIERSSFVVVIEDKTGAGVDAGFNVSVN